MLSDSHDLMHGQCIINDWRWLIDVLVMVECGVDGGFIVVIGHHGWSLVSRIRLTDVGHDDVAITC